MTTHSDAILDAIEMSVRQPRRRAADRLDFYCDLDHRSRTAHARAWIDDAGKVGVCCFNDASHNRAWWETLVKPHLREPAYGTPEWDALAAERVDYQERRLTRIRDWDSLVADVARDMGQPTPFPTEPPPETLRETLRQSDGHAATFRPPIRDDFLPEWAQRAMDAAGLTTNAG